MQKIKVIFTVPSKDLKKSESVLLLVNMNIPANNEVCSNIEFSVRIPDFMFNELANTEPKFKTTYDVNNRDYSGLFSGRTLQRKFKKTQTSLNESVESFESKYSIIDWTEEREEFCEKIRLRFLEVNKQLDNFLKDINDDKIELMMSEFEHKMLKG